MYVIAWTDPDGIIHRSTEQYPTDASSLIMSIANNDALYGLGVQYDTLDEVFDLLRRMDGDIPFDDQAAGDRLTYISHAAPDFAVTSASDPAPFMHYPMPEGR